MKKILSMGVLALVALVAATFTSCSKDDEEGDFTFNGTISSVADIDTNFENAIISAYQSIVGSNATVKATSSNTFTITCKESYKQTVVESITNTNMSGLRSTLDNLFTISHAIISVEYGEKVPLLYEYNMTPEKLLIGTFKGTANGKDLQWTISKKLSETEYESTVVFDGKSYSGTTIYSTDHDDITFETDDFKLMSLGTLSVSFDAGVKVLSVDINILGILYTDISLTRQ